MAVADDDIAVTPALPWPAPLPWQASALAALAGARERLPHALLVHGLAGIGKHAFALHLAQALLCEAPRADGTACGECAGCRYAVAGQHPDLMRLELTTLDEESGEPVRAETIAVERVRALIDFVQLTSHRQGMKVGVIAPADRMNVSAVNALLKTLEEPPPRTHLILVTDQPGRLLATVRSRCRHVLAPRPTANEAREWLIAHGVADPESLLAQAGGAPLAALMLADPVRQQERQLWLAAFADPDALRVTQLAGADRRGGPRRPQGTACEHDRVAARLDRGPRPCRTRRGADPQCRLRRGDGLAGDAGGAASAVSLSSTAASAAHAAAPPVAAAARRGSAAARLPRPFPARDCPLMADKPAPSSAAANPAARPGVLSLNIREKAALYAAYMPFLRGGGIFIPTSRQYQLGEDVFMLLSLMDDPNRIAVQGKVVWITPEGVQGNRTQGIGVQFTQDEAGAAARATIEKVLGETLASSRPTHTM